jgi:hypothetical protein
MSSTQRHFTLVANQKLWMIDLVERKVTPLVDCPGPAALGSAWETFDELPDAPASRHAAAMQWVEHKIVLRERERLTLIDPKTHERESYPLPKDLRGVMLAVFELADGRLLLTAYKNPAASSEIEVVRLSKQGEVTERKVVRIRQFTGMDEREFAWSSVMAAPFPLATGLLMFFMQSMMVEQGRAETYSEALSEVLQHMAPAIIVVIVIGAIAAVAAYRRQRRYALPHAWPWALFAFIMGVPGWLAYRFHRTWPAVADCPSCSQPAPRDRDHCSQCGAAFPPPPRKGIEVFA